LETSLSQAAAAQAASYGPPLVPPAVPPGPQNPYQQPPPPNVNQRLMIRDNIREHAKFTQVVMDSQNPRSQVSHSGNRQLLPSPLCRLQPHQL
jgi:hypothetical protein